MYSTKVKVSRMFTLRTGEETNRALLEINENAKKWSVPSQIQFQYFKNTCYEVIDFIISDA